MKDNQINYRCLVVKYIEDLVSIRYLYKEVYRLILYRCIVNNVNNLQKKRAFIGIPAI